MFKRFFLLRLFPANSNRGTIITKKSFKFNPEESDNGKTHWSFSVKYLISTKKYMLNKAGDGRILALLQGDFKSLCNNKKSIIRQNKIQNL